MYEGTVQFPDALLEAVRHDRLIPFVGTRLTRDVKNRQGQSVIPDWQAFLGDAVAELKHEENSDARRLRDLLNHKRPDLFQAVLLARGAMGKRWPAFLHRKLSPSYMDIDPASLEVVRTIWRLSHDLVITTALDRGLTWACPRLHDLRQWVIEPPNFHTAITHIDRPTIWHINGFIEQPGSLVLTPDGRRRIYPEVTGAPQRYRSALHSLQSLLVSRTFLFIGYSAEDPYFVHLLHQVNDLFHLCGGPHYALVEEQDKEKLMTRTLGLPVKLVLYKGSLEDTLDALCLQQPSLERSDPFAGYDDATTQAKTISLRGHRQPEAENEIGKTPGEETNEGHTLPARYKVLEKLGQGGMGMVFRAHDNELEREVAVKIILPHMLDEDMVQRFQQEARAIAKLDHPGVVPIYDYGRFKDNMYFTMPLAKGRPLRAFMRESGLKILQKLDICAQLAEALGYSHFRGVFHCDVKPENIMVDDAFRVRVMDFGLARLASRDRITRPGDLMGTPLYLSPEQISSGKVDGRTDIYSLGTIIYEFLAGETPFKGTFHSLIYKIVHERPPLLLSRGIECDEELESLVLRCLAKDPEKRPCSGEELALELREYIDKRNPRTSGYSWPSIPRDHSMPPLVGREDEMVELHLRMDACLAGVCQFACIGGDSGMGKTRVLQEVERMAMGMEEPFKVLWGRFADQDGSMPYQAFCELVQSYFATQTETGEIPPDLSDLAPDLVTYMPVLAEIKSIRDAAGKIPKPTRIQPSEGGGQSFVFELMARTLRRLSRDKPTVLLLENLAGAGGSLEALQYLTHRMGPTPTLIVATYRTGLPKMHPIYRFLDGFEGDRRFIKMELKPLDRERHRRLITALLQEGEPSRELAEKLYETSEGNPSFANELVRTLRENGGIVRDSLGNWVLSDEAVLHHDVLPSTIQQAVEERVKHLPDTARETLSTAAVLGRRFSFADLEAMEEHPLILDDTLELLVHEGFLEEDGRSRGDIFAFRGKVLREVLYHRFSRRKRRRLHRRYAVHLERRFSGKIERVLPALVHHFSNADDADKTVAYAIKLAERSLESYSPEDARHCATLALSFVREEGFEGGSLVEGRLCMLVARAHLAMGHLELALSEATEAVRAYKRGNDAAGAAEASLLASEMAWRLHKISVTQRFVENGIALANTGGVTQVLYHLLTLAAKVANLRRDYDQATVYMREAEKLAPKPTLESGSGPISFGGKLTTAVCRPIGSLHPGKIQSPEELELAACIFETLMDVDEEGRLCACLAERYEISQNGRVFHFFLNPASAFSDGMPLEASHVKHAFEMAARGSVGQGAPFFLTLVGFEAFQKGDRNDIEGLKVIDQQTLSISLDEPLPTLPALLTDKANTSIFRVSGPPERVSLLGSGPFVLDSREAGRITMVRNGRFWRKTMSFVEQVECQVLPSSEQMMGAMRAGELDLGRSFLDEQIDELLRMPQYQRGLLEATNKNVTFLIFNDTSRKVGDRRVRRALCGMLRVRQMVWNTLGRSAQPACSLIPPGILGHDPARREIRPMESGNELRILKTCGLQPPIKLRAAIHPILQERYGAMLNSIFREWMTLDVDVEVVTPNLESFLDAQASGDDIDILITRYRGAYDDPDAFTYRLFHPKDGLLARYFELPEATRLMTRARQERDGEVRAQIYRKLEALLLDYQLVLPLCHDIDCRIASANLKGAMLGAVPPFLNYHEVGKMDRVPLPVPQGVLRIPIADRLEHLDPAQMQAYDYGEVVPNLFETLTRVGKGAHVDPWLASFQSEAGGRIYHFHLRENVFFHDGRRLTARDVRSTFERVLRESELHGPLLHCISGATAFAAGKLREIVGLRLISDMHFIIELEKPLSFFPGMLTHPALGIMPEGTPLQPKTEDYIGTGPFRLTRFEEGELVIMEINPQYWRKGYPRCDRLEFHLGMTPEVISSSFRRNRLSLARGVYPSELEALRQQAGFREGVPESPGLSTYFMVFNTRRGIFEDRELRKAFVGSLDIAQTIKTTLPGMGIPAHGLIPPGLTGHEVVPKPNKRELHTQRLLRHKEINLSVHPFFFRQYVRFWEQLSRTPGELGMKFNVVHQDVISNLREIPGHVDIVAYRWFADYPDADTFVKLLHSKTGLFGPMLANDRIDLLIEKGAIETDASLRREIYREIEEIMAHEVMVLPLFHETQICIARPDVEGLSIRIGFPIVAYERLSIAPEDK